MSASAGSQSEQDLVEMTPRQRAAANARAHRKPGFTPEGIEHLRAAALEAKPWTRSTGPTSPKGKATSSRNAWKGGHRARLELSRSWRLDLSEWLRDLDVEAANEQIRAAIQAVRLGRLTEPLDDALDRVGEAADAIPQGRVQVHDL